MVGRSFWKIAALFMAVVWLVAGCDGILYQKPHANGGVDRLRIDGGEDWGDYDVTPRYQSQKKKDQDGYYMMLKSEKTF